MITPADFVHTIKDFYLKNGRDLPWRRDITPYRIYVSEIMLQQTQVSRVLVKFDQFLTQYPTFESLANSSTADLLGAWRGMGYSRRAMNMRSTAQIICEKFDSQLPRDPAVLVTLPGVGPGTAGSLAAFAYNIPSVFIETNIRRVYIHFFFDDQENITDKQLTPFIADTLDHDNPREWYYALMDYGSHLRKLVPNPNRRSRHYVRQSPFEGSDRQVRSRILHALLEQRSLSDNQLRLLVDNPRYENILEQLIAEKFVSRHGNEYRIAA